MKRSAAKRLTQSLSLSLLSLGLLAGTYLVKTNLDSRRQALAGVRVDTFTYRTLGTQELKLDLCRPTNNTTPLPTIIFIHGGGWNLGDRSLFLEHCQKAAQAGFVATTIDYRLSPTNRFPTQLYDVQYVVRWLREHNNSGYLIDPSKIAAWGHSSGGTLALMLGSLDTLEPNAPLSQHSSRVQAVIDEYGPTNLANPYYQNVSTPTYPEMKQVIDNYLGFTYSHYPAIYTQASPISYLNAQSAPTLVIHGTQDTLVPINESENLVVSLNQLNHPTQLLTYTGGHALRIPDPHFDRIWQSEIDFLTGIFAQNHCLNPTRLLQGYWQADKAYLRYIPVVNSQPSWSQATPWTGGQNLADDLPGSGAFQSLDNLVFPHGRTLIQSFWRGNEGRVRLVPITATGISWNQAGSWSNPIGLDGLPENTGAIQTQTSYASPKGQAIYQVVWRNNHGYFHTVNVRADGIPDWNRSSAWQTLPTILPINSYTSLQTYSLSLLPGGQSLLESVILDSKGYLRYLTLNDQGFPNFPATNTGWSAPIAITPPTTPSTGIVSANVLMPENCPINLNPPPPSSLGSLLPINPPPPFPTPSPAQSLTPTPTLSSTSIKSPKVVKPINPITR